MGKKYLIFAPSYNENNGGVIVQHKLCSILNELGYESYLHPPFARYYEIDKNSFHLTLKSLLGFLKRVFVKLHKNHKTYKNYKTNPAFNTPVFDQKNTVFDNDWIVIYPEITFGNPLQAKNVVRWILYHPGAHNNRIFYGQNDFFIKYNTAFSNISFSGYTTSENELKVVYYPLEHYNMDNCSHNRSGTAYCLRKGKNKPIQHDLKDSILIDGKSHAEIAAIFKRVKTFISYDAYTAYSWFAVLCGCDSVIIPDKGVTKEQWQPNPTDRFGLSYGFNELDQARSTAHLVKQHVIEEEEKSITSVRNFVLEAERFFP